MSRPPPPVNPEDRFRLALEDLLARIGDADSTLTLSVSSDRAGAGGDGAPDDLLLRTFGGFQVLEPVGRGGMGVVYKAVQLDPGRPVALKVLAPRLRADPAARARFRHEVRVAARLHHTHLVPVFAAAQGADGPDAYAMPFIRGLSLAAVVRGLRGGFPEAPPHPGFVRVAALYRTDPRAYAREVVGWVRQAAEALDAAHRAGVVHRDVKPGNLLLEFTPAGRPHVWVHDFGLACQEGEEDGWASAGGFGTRGYASPEMTAGDPAHRHPRTDIYALGVTLYELLMLRRPRPEELTGARAGGVPRELIRVVKAAMTGGYATACELATDRDR
ncbi:serine/threonine protein kinase [bacterium]|nr:serine/threonine protein kinase [bacterium]